MNRRLMHGVLVAAVGLLTSVARAEDDTLVKRLDSVLAQARASKKEYRFAAAWGSYRRAVLLAYAVHGRDDPRTAALMTEAAAVAREWGQYDDAEKFLQRSLAIQEAKLGKEHVDVARTLNE